MEKKLNCVVLVDDNESHNYYHKFELQEANCAHEIASFVNAQDALNFVINRFQANNTPNLVFLDYNMPNIQGKQFIEKLNKVSNKITDEMIVIMLSASEIEDVDKMIEIGASEFMVKPVDRPAISKILSQYF